MPSRRTIEPPYTEDELRRARAEVDGYFEDDHWSTDSETGEQDKAEEVREKELDVLRMVRINRRHDKHSQWWKDFNYEKIERKHLRDNMTLANLSQADYHSLPPAAQIDFDNAAVAPTLAAYNIQIPLSPSVRSDSGASNAASSEDDEEKSNRVDNNRFRIAVRKWNRYRRDHPRACGGALVPIPSTPYAFNNLPVEIRREILSLLLKRSKELRQMLPNGTAPEDEGNTPPSHTIPSPMVSP